MHSELFPNAGVQDCDRTLLKEASSDHNAFRGHTGDGDITWQVQMQKSGILCFELVEDFFLNALYSLCFSFKCCFNINFDTPCRTWSMAESMTMVSVKQAAKQGGTAEHVFEQEPVKDRGTG